MLGSVYKTSLEKQKPKRFDNEKIKESLITFNNFSTTKNMSYHAFEKLILYTINKMAPIKQKFIRGKQPRFKRL